MTTEYSKNACACKSDLTILGGDAYGHHLVKCTGCGRQFWAVPGPHAAAVGDRLRETYIKKKSN